MTKPQETDVLEDAELREVTDDELDDVEETEAPEQPLPEWAETRTVTVYGREFTIEQPDTGITLRILNVFGMLGVRGERVAMRALATLGRGTRQAPSPSGRAAMFGILAALNVEDLCSLGAAVLHFETNKEGVAWLRNPPDGQQLPLSPLIRALFLNVLLSDDLSEALADFFDGLRITESKFSILNLNIG